MLAKIHSQSHQQKTLPSKTPQINLKNQFQKSPTKKPTKPLFTKRHQK
jgi:hypothetical protein